MFTTALKTLDEQLPDGQKFSRIVIHELRHSHASMLVNHGASIMVIAQGLGHANSNEVYNDMAIYIPVHKKK